MRFHQPLDTALNSAAKIRILRFFCRKGGEWSGRRVASHLELNPVTAHRALRELYEATILDFRKTGNNFIYSLRRNHYLVRALLEPLFNQEAGSRDRLLELFEQSFSSGEKRKIAAVAIYGSVARGEERPTSDIDLLMLVESEQSKRRIRDPLDRFCDRILEDFRNVPSVYVNTLPEARRKVQRKLPVFQNILRDHQLIWGKPLREALYAKTA